MRSCVANECTFLWRVAISGHSHTTSMCAWPMSAASGCQDSAGSAASSARVAARIASTPPDTQASQHSSMPRMSRRSSGDTSSNAGR